MSVLHDNELLSYAVDFREKTVLLNTEYWYENINEKTTVIFKNVTAHWFIDAGEMTTIIFDICCYDVERFIRDYKPLLKERKGYGWPLSGYTDDNDLLGKLHALNQKYFSVESSCGVSGFILAEEMQLNTEAIKE